MTMLSQRDDNSLAASSKQSQKNTKYFLKLCENLYRRWLSPLTVLKIICLFSCSTLRKDFISHGQYFHSIHREASLLVYLQTSSVVQKVGSRCYKHVEYYEEGVFDKVLATSVF